MYVLFKNEVWKRFIKALKLNIIDNRFVKWCHINEQYIIKVHIMYSVIILTYYYCDTVNFIGTQIISWFYRLFRRCKFTEKGFPEQKTTKIFNLIKIIFINYKIF